jgi:hypothetical protein
LRERERWMNGEGRERNEGKRKMDEWGRKGKEGRTRWEWDVVVPSSIILLGRVCLVLVSSGSLLTFN